MTNTFVPLTHDQRRQLIEQPLAIRTVGGGARWSGAGVASDDGLHRAYTPKIAAFDDAFTPGDNSGK